MPLRRRSGLSVAVLCLLAVGSPAATTAQALPTVRIASSAAETYLQAAFADKLGLFQKAGLDAGVDILATGAAVSTAVAGGAEDVGVATTVNLANAVERGVPFVMIAPGPMTTAKNPTGLLCVGKNAAYKSAKDFEGQVIAVPAIHQTADLAVDAWLAKGGVDLSAVHYVEARFSDMGPGLERGTYAAATLSEPSLTRAQKDGEVRCIADPYGAVAHQYMFAAWFTTRQFAQSHPDVVRKVAQALTEAAAWANTHQADSAPIVAAINKIPADTILAEVRPVYATKIDPNEIQPQLDAGYKFGFLTRPMRADELMLH